MIPNFEMEQKRFPRRSKTISTVFERMFLNTTTLGHSELSFRQLGTQQTAGIWWIWWMVGLI